MDYISVKQAAQLFEISERRVQKLCETNRIEGCKRVSGVWIIPADAQKPLDDRISGVPDNSNCVSLKDLCSILSISTATGRNWIKLGKLIPKYTDKKVPYFTKEYVDTLKTGIESGTNKALKSRRNKKYVSGNALYNSYVSAQCKNLISLQKLLSLVTDNSIELNDTTIKLLVADCALHLFASKNAIQIPNENNLVLHFLNKNFSIGEYDDLILDLFEDKKGAALFCQKHPILFSIRYTYEPNEDVLGLIYISCNNVGSRKATGSYYTPTKVVKALISKLKIQEMDKVLDPCCGTGNFLLQLPPTTSFDSIYGNDIDSVSVKITRINMALKYGASVTKLIEHITEMDFLTSFQVNDFQHIIGNPPWGYEFTENEIISLRKKYKSSAGRNIESYDVFIEQSLNLLAKNGHLAYVLPEAILNVKAHTGIRKILLQVCSIKNLDFLGNAFDGVQCPCIIMDLAYTKQPLSTFGMTVNTGSRSFEINTEREVSSEYFSFTTDDLEYSLLKKIRNLSACKYLAGNADFALGIVTGNNKKFVSDVKVAENEMVLKGADIRKYHINPTTNFIAFKPEHFQQIAPKEMYRAKEKLFYRFISSQLVFAYDNKQTLSLNSCNIVIPRIDGMKTKYILAILNSRVAQFIYKKEFNSVKVLRSHIESIPIPLVDESKQSEIIAMTEKLIAGLKLNEAEAAYEELDMLICRIFNLDSAEIEILKMAVDGENRFLV